MFNKCKKSLFLSFALIISITITSFADFNISKEEIFNGLDPQKVLNKIWTSTEKNKLKSGTVLYENIDDMVHLFNPEILNNWNEWENNKSSNDIYNDYMDAASRLENSGSSDVENEIYAAQADAMRIQADKNADDSYTKFLTYYLEEKNTVLATKILSLNYYKTDYELKNAEESIAECERKLETEKNKLSVGSGTRVDYLSAEKNLSDAKSTLITAKSNKSTYQRNFLTNVGYSMNDNIKIGEVSLDTTSYIQKINLNNDYEKALKNNIQYEIYKRKLNNANTKEVKNEYQILVDAAEQKIYNDIESKYNDVMDAMETLANRITAIQYVERALKQAENNFATGNISEKEYKTALYNNNVANNNGDIAKYDLKIACENYEASVNGYYSF